MTRTQQLLLQSGWDTGFGGPSMPGGDGPAEFVAQAVAVDASPSGLLASNGARLSFLP